MRWIAQVWFLTAITTAQVAGLAADEPKRQASELRGATPGVTAKAELLTDEKWGQPDQLRDGPGGEEYLLYRHGKSQITVTVANGIVRTLDVRLPAQTPLADLEGTVALGNRSTDAEIPAEAHVGLEVPGEWAAHLYGERCAVVYTKPGPAPEAAMVRFFACVEPEDLPVCTTSQESEEACLKGIDLLKEIRVDDALASLTEAIRHDPEHYCAYYHRSECYLRQGRNDDALRDIRRAIDLSADDPFFHARLSQTLNLKANHVEAVAAADRAIQLDAQCAYGYSQRALANHKLGRHNSALADHNRAVELLPDDFSVYYARGEFLTFVNENRRALQDADRAVQLGPNHAPSHCLRAYCRNLLRDSQGALADVNRAIELQPEYGYAYGLRATIHAKLHNHRQAEADRRTATQLQGR